MNEHLKLKKVSGDTVWGGVSSGEGLGRVPKTGKIVANLNPKILSLKHPDFLLLSFKVWLLFYFT